MKTEVVAVQYFLLCLLFQSSLSETHNVNWTIAGVSALNNTIEVELGDTLALVCGSNYSNVVLQRSSEQFINCDSTLGTSRATLGKCTSTGLVLSIEIQRSSAQLNSSTSFFPDTTVYLTSYSDGTSIASAFHNTTLGGECLSGLKLKVYIRNTPTTGEESSTRPSTVSTTTEKLLTTEKPITSQPPKDDETTKKINVGNPGGISSGTSAHIHTLHSLLCLILCSLLTCVLR